MVQSTVLATNQPDESPTLVAAHTRFVTDTAVQVAHYDKLLKNEKEVAPWLAMVLDGIRDTLEALGSPVSFVFWAGLALLVGFLLHFLVTEVMDIKLLRPKPEANVANETYDWRPSTKEARDLLAAADKLANEGNFNEAVHLILLRSVEHIDQFRPFAVRSALTAREIGALSALPEPARPNFMRITNIVERSLFAGLDIDRSQFSACRQAYADFVQPDEWRT